MTLKGKMSLMEISGSTAFYAGLSSIQAGQNCVDQAGGHIANATVERSVASQSSDTQVNRMRAVDRSQLSDIASDVADLSVGKAQVELGAKVVRTADEMVGTLIDTYA